MVQVPFDLSRWTLVPGSLGGAVNHTAVYSNVVKFKQCGAKFTKTKTREQ